jgi:hypothetical protein
MIRMQSVKKKRGDSKIYSIIANRFFNFFASINIKICVCREVEEKHLSFLFFLNTKTFYLLLLTLKIISTCSFLFFWFFIFFNSLLRDSTSYQKQLLRFFSLFFFIPSLFSSFLYTPISPHILYFFFLKQHRKCMFVRFGLC